MTVYGAGMVKYNLHVQPLVLNQEFVGDTEIIGKLVAFKTLYWEGACSVSGTRNGVPVSGNAYVELTGYDGKQTQL